jgi:hypothetical protein
LSFIKKHAVVQPTAPWSQKPYYSHWFSRSAWSLVAIVRWYQACSKINALTVWVPDYFCNQSLMGIRDAGVQLLFYPMTADMTPMWEQCHALSKEYPPHLFLLPHYFGKANELTETKQFCKRHQAIFIEDCAHTLIPSRGMGLTGDFVLYSPHKTLDLPDGALLLARPSVMKLFQNEAHDFITTFDAAVSKLPEQAFPVKAWLLKRVMRKLLPHSMLMAAKRHRMRSVPASQARGLLFPARQSKLSKRLMNRCISYLEAYGWQRYCHAALLKDAFLNHQGTQRILFEESTHFPYFIGVENNNPHVMQLKGKYFSSLKWPDLPPEVLQNPSKHEVAIALEEKLTFFPVHHRLNIRRALKALKINTTSNALSRDASTCMFEVEWDVAGDVWSRWFSQASKTHLQQSYAYVRAFQQDKGWKPRFGLIKSDHKVLAVFVVLEKKGPLGFVVGRLNRGPIWLDETLDEQSQVSALTAIARDYRLRRGCILFSAPNISMSTEAIPFLYHKKFHRRMLRPYASIVLDLRDTIDNLRASLDGKWRNQLSLAERKGMEFSLNEDIGDFEWLLEQHEKMMQGRGFSGPTVRFLQYLWHALKAAGQPFFVLRAFYEGQCVGGIALVGHGRSATYLIGYNDDVGRKLNANNFLLWHAVCVLKNHDFEWFDLGGINEYETPGITVFKRGMRGDEYRLVGEYVSRRFS